MLGALSSSVNMYVFGAEVARLMRSAAARGEVADLVRARKGCEREFGVSRLIFESGRSRWQLVVG